MKKILIIFICFFILTDISAQILLTEQIEPDCRKDKNPLYWNTFYYNSMKEIPKEELIISNEVKKLTIKIKYEKPAYPEMNDYFEEFHFSSDGIMKYVEQNNRGEPIYWERIDSISKEGNTFTSYYRLNKYKNTFNRIFYYEDDCLSKVISLKNNIIIYNTIIDRSNPHHIIIMDSINTLGIKNEKTELLFDEKKRPLKTIISSSNNDNGYNKTWTYDSLSTTTTDTYGNFEYLNYNEQKLCVELEEKYGILKTEYDQNGRVTKKTGARKDCNSKDKAEYSYYKNGLLKSIAYYSDGNLLSYKTTYKYEYHK